MAKMHGKDGEIQIGAASPYQVIGSLNASGVFVSDWANPQRMEWGISGAAFAPSTWYAPLTFNQLPGGRVVQMGWQPSNPASKSSPSCGSCRCEKTRPENPDRSIKGTADGVAMPAPVLSIEPFAVLSQLIPCTATTFTTTAEG